MKKVFMIIVLLSSFLFIRGGVKAETFLKGEYLTGTYVKKIKGDKTHYLTLQFINDENGNVVYCLEPWETFYEGSIYSKIEGDLVSYKKLTEEQKRRISLLVYYGYGYGGRTASYWYSIVQLLIWKTADPDANIFFTDTLNGTIKYRYSADTRTLEQNVEAHDKELKLEYDVDYMGSVELSDIDDTYEIVSSDFSYSLGTTIKINNITKSGKIVVRKKGNMYGGKIAIFSSDESQDLIRPGNIVNEAKTISINVKTGNLVLDIQDDDSVYTVESDFRNTCYDIFKGETVVDSICTDDEKMVYRTGPLEYGDYSVKQRSHGIGYREDTKVYSITISDSNKEPVIPLVNQLIRNDINIVKYACRDNVCAYERNAQFEITDIRGNVVDTLITDELGKAKKILGFGTYRISQVMGESNYTLADSFSEKIVDEVTEHKRELFNYYNKIEDPIIPEPEEIEDPDILPDDEITEEVEDLILDVEEIPNTKVDFNIRDFILKIWAAIKRILSLVVII